MQNISETVSFIQTTSTLATFVDSVYVWNQLKERIQLTLGPICTAVLKWCGKYLNFVFSTQKHWLETLEGYAGQVYNTVYS